jgi:hypothetical protein
MGCSHGRDPIIVLDAEILFLRDLKLNIAFRRLANLLPDLGQVEVLEPQRLRCELNLADKVHFFICDQKIISY